jgi:hypothetical protein
VTAALSLPPVSKLREVLRLLAFDTSRIPLQGMTTDRQRSALAATAATALIAKLSNHTLSVDQLTDAERYMLNVSPVADVSGGDGPSGLAFAAYLLAWANDVITEVTRGDATGHHTPGPAIRELLTAVALLLETCQRAHEAPGFEVGGEVGGTAYHSVAAPEVRSALEHLREAAAAVERLAGPGRR